MREGQCLVLHPTLAIERLQSVSDVAGDSAASGYLVGLPRGPQKEDTEQEEAVPGPYPLRTLEPTEGEPPNCPGY